MDKYDIETWALKNIKHKVSYGSGLLEPKNIEVIDNVIYLKNIIGIRNYLSIGIDSPFPDGISLAPLPIKHHAINCDYYRYKIPVENFRGWPEIVNGDLILSYNMIESFEFMPKIITGNVWLLGVKIKSFDYFTQEINKIKGTDMLEEIPGYNMVKFISNLPKF